MCSNDLCEFEPINILISKLALTLAFANYSEKIKQRVIFSIQRGVVISFVTFYFLLYLKKIRFDSAECRIFGSEGPTGNDRCFQSCRESHRIRMISCPVTLSVSLAIYKGSHLVSLYYFIFTFQCNWWRGFSSRISCHQVKHHRIKSTSFTNMV